MGLGKPTLSGALVIQSLGLLSSFAGEVSARLGRRVAAGPMPNLRTLKIRNAKTQMPQPMACADQITQLRQAAQLDHEPTPESVGQAQTYAQLSFAAELAQAEAQDALGHEPDCLLAARRAKQVLELP
jgi:hypothetical protein